MTKETDTYEEVLNIQDKDGLTLMVTRRESTNGPKFTFSVLRQYQKKDGSPARTPWFWPNQVDALIKLLQQHTETLKQLSAFKASK